MNKNEMQKILVDADIDFTEEMTKAELQDLIDTIETEDETPEGKKVFLKQIRPHKKGFRLGRHLVKGGAAQEFYLDEKEEKELETAGPKHWIKEVSEKEMDVAPTSNKENRERMGIIKYLKENNIAFEKEMSLEELRELKK